MMRIVAWCVCNSRRVSCSLNDEEQSVQDLPTSRGLSQEMEKIAQQHVEHVSVVAVSARVQFTIPPHAEYA